VGAEAVRLECPLSSTGTKHHTFFLKGEQMEQEDWAKDLSALLTFKREMPDETVTAIEVPFKAICPVPVPPRFYYGVVSLKYSAHMVFDFNQIEAVLDSFVAGPNQRSVEDVLEFCLDLMSLVIPPHSLGTSGVDKPWVQVTVCVPAQKGHLEVAVGAGRTL
jgi:hypothetical protein